MSHVSLFFRLFSVSIRVSVSYYVHLQSASDITVMGRLLGAVPSQDRVKLAVPTLDHDVDVSQQKLIKQVRAVVYSV